MRQIFFCAMLLALVACKHQQADTLFYNAKIYTVDSGFTTAEAMVVKDGQILAIGTNKEIQEQYQAKETIDLKGKPMYPGLIDAHAHFVGYGQSLFYANLYGTTSFEEAVARVKAFADEHPDLTWIQGRGWDQNKWPGKTYPTNELLNKAFPDKPVILQRVDGHASIANQKAMDLAGLKPGQTIVGGSIETINEN